MADGADEKSPVLLVVQKRIRAVRKKLTRVQELETLQASGKELTPEQLPVVRSRPVLAGVLEELQKVDDGIRDALNTELHAAYERGVAEGRRLANAEIASQIDEINATHQQQLSDLQSAHDLNIAQLQEEWQIKMDETRRQSEKDIADAAAAAATAAIANALEQPLSHTHPFKSFVQKQIVKLLHLQYFSNLFDVYRNPWLYNQEMQACLKYDDQLPVPQGQSRLVQKDLGDIIYFGRMIMDRGTNALSHEDHLQNALTLAMNYLADTSAMAIPSPPAPTLVTMGDVQRSLERIKASQFYSVTPTNPGAGPAAAPATAIPAVPPPATAATVAAAARGTSGVPPTATGSLPTPATTSSLASSAVSNVVAPAPASSQPSAPPASSVTHQAPAASKPLGAAAQQSDKAPAKPVGVYVPPIPKKSAFAAATAPQQALSGHGSFGSHTASSTQATAGTVTASSLGKPAKADSMSTRSQSSAAPTGMGSLTASTQPTQPMPMSHETVLGSNVSRAPGGATTGSGFLSNYQQLPSFMEDVADYEGAAGGGVDPLSHAFGAGFGDIGSGFAAAERTGSGRQQPTSNIPAVVPGKFMLSDTGLPVSLEDDNRRAPAGYGHGQLPKPVASGVSGSGGQVSDKNANVFGDLIGSQSRMGGIGYQPAVRGPSHRPPGHHGNGQHVGRA